MDNPALLVVLAALGLLGAGLSGLLGIGGAIFIVPLLLYVPEWLGIGELDIRQASGIVVAQVAASMLSGAIAHARRGGLSIRLVVVLSITMILAGFGGGVLSSVIPSFWLLLLFAVLVTLAAGLMLIPPASERALLGDVRFSVPIVVGCGLVVGTLIGLLGAGSFLMLPLLIYVVKLPTRTAMTTVLAVGFPSAMASLLGKAATGQVPFAEAIAVVVAAVPGAQAGSWLSARLSPTTLRRIYSVVISLVAFGLWWDVTH